MKKYILNKIENIELDSSDWGFIKTSTSTLTKDELESNIKIDKFIYMIKGESYEYIPVMMKYFEYLEENDLPYSRFEKKEEMIIEALENLKC